MSFLIMLCRIGVVIAGMWLTVVAARADDIGCVDTAWQLFGNHKVCVYAFDDPAVSGVACHVSQARAGGLGGLTGWGEDPSRFSLACRQVGPITANLGVLPDKQSVFLANTSPFFKKTQVIRMIDAQRKTLVYLAISDKLIDGSPQNSISTVPIMSWREVDAKETNAVARPPAQARPSVPQSR